MIRRRALLAASQMGSSNSPITFYLTDHLNNLHQFNIPYSMTWGEFVASEYNPVNEIGDKSFNDIGIIQYGIVYSEKTPDGMDYWTEYVEIYIIKDFSGVVYSNEYIKKDKNYLI